MIFVVCRNSTTGEGNKPRIFVLLRLIRKEDFINRVRSSNRISCVELELTQIDIEHCTAAISRGTGKGVVDSHDTVVGIGISIARTSLLKCYFGSIAEIEFTFSGQTTDCLRVASLEILIGKPNRRIIVDVQIRGTAESVVFSENDGNCLSVGVTANISNIGLPRVAMEP